MDRRTLERTAAQHSYLRGLLFVPGGLVLILAALANEEVGPLRAVWTFPVAILVLGAAALAINRFYEDRYGRMTPSPAQQARAAVAAAVAIAIMVAGCFLLRSDAQWSLDLPVNAVAICFALVLLVSYASGAGLRPHHVAIAGALLVIGAVPVWNGDDPANTGLALGGIALMLSGALDHREFVRTFGPARARGV